jgi:hypothetical protein
VVRMLIIVHHISIPFQMTNFGVWSGRRFMWFFRRHHL